MSTTLVRNDRDAWLLRNRDRVKLNTIEAVAIELRRIGLYSKKARILDIMQQVVKACRRLEIDTGALQ